MRKMRLFAFPYAMGTGNIFSNLRKSLSENINLIPMEYPGHGSRCNEDLKYSIRSIAEDAYQKIHIQLDYPYKLLGYSMGGLVCYELYKIINENGKPLPEGMFIFGTDGPSCLSKYINVQDMNEERIMEVLRETGGTSEEIIKDTELMKYLLPIFQADFISIERYRSEPIHNHEIMCDLIVVRGTNEKRDKNCISEWSKLAKKKFSYLYMDGGHFFMFGDEQIMCKCAYLIQNHRS